MEPPGIAPGSRSLISRAFISIDRPKPDPSNIGTKGYGVKNRMNFDTDPRPEMRMRRPSVPGLARHGAA